MSATDLFAGYLSGPELLLSAGKLADATSWLVSASNEIQARDKHADVMASNDDYWSEGMSWLRPYNVKDGILTIPIEGALVDGFSGTLWGWITGYDYIEQAMLRGMSDGNVRGIALAINSPGGMVSGCFELTDKLVTMMAEGPADMPKARKPVKAFCKLAASAAYAIASTADEIIIGRTNIVGSVGVMTMHTSYEKALDKAGIDVTFIYAGKFKVEGNAYEALSEDAKARIQERIDHIYGIFVSTVAKNRGMSEKAVRDTEALTYFGQSAIDVGLADKVANLTEAMLAYRKETGRSNGDRYMATKENTADTAETTKSAAEIAAEAVKADRERVAAILGHEEAKGREATAQQLAANGTGVEEAVAILKTVPKASAKAEEGAYSPGFEKAMNTDKPDVGAGGGKGGEGAEGGSHASRILASVTRVTGRKFETSSAE